MGMSQNWSSNGPTHPHTLCKTKALEKEVVKIEVSAGFCTFSIHWIPSICVQFALLIPFFDLMTLVRAMLAMLWRKIFS